MNYSNRQKCFAIMLVMAVLMLFMTGSFTAFADENYVTSEEVVEEDTAVDVSVNPDEIPEAAQEDDILYSTFSEDEAEGIPEEENAVLFSMDGEGEDMGAYARMAPAPHEETIGDKIDKVFFNFDIAGFRLFGKLQNSVTLMMAKAFTSLASETFTALVAILAVVLCLFKRTRKYGFSILLAIAVGTVLVNLVLKNTIVRIRPYNTLQLTDFWTEYSVWYKAAGSLAESYGSFPSGHSNSAFEMATAIFLCMMGDKNKRKIAWIFPLIALVVACSRVIIMVHYPSDVIAGSLAGIFSGTVAFLLAKLACRIFEKVKFLNAIDLEKLFKKGLNTKLASVAIAVACLIFFGISFGKLLNLNEDVKCAYNVEYKCNNKAKVMGEKQHTADDGANYCKIHWKQINSAEE